MPVILKQKIEALTGGQKQNGVRESAARLSSRYRTAERRGQTLIESGLDAVSYAVSRMPATFGAFSVVLEQAAGIPDFSPKTMIDAGAGTGSAVWAAACFFNLQKITCLERSPEMRAIGEKLSADTPSFFSAPPDWRSFDLISEALPQADLVTAGYVLNEPDERDRTNVLLNLWNAAQSVLVLIEPGTPDSFCRMKAFRELLIKNGAFIAAPCPHRNGCLNEWCHFGCRVARSRLHRMAKGGDAPFEDEKFCYLIATRRKYANTAPRVLRRPVIGTGKVTLSLCTENGIMEKTFSKKDGVAYKAARKAGWADSFIPRE